MHCVLAPHQNLIKIDFFHRRFRRLWDQRPTNRSLVAITTCQRFDENKEMSNSLSPVHEIQIGRIRATIWRNQNDGRAWFSVQVVRLYREGDTWKSTSSFSRDDLPVVAKVADMAYSWIWSSDQGGDHA